MPVSESGPDLGSFSGGAAAGGSLMGSNQLQQAIDKNTQATDKNTQAIQQGQSQGSAAGTPLAGQSTGSFGRPQSVNIEEGLGTPGGGGRQTLNQLAGNIGPGQGQGAGATGFGGGGNGGGASFGGGAGRSGGGSGGLNIGGALGAVTGALASTGASSMGTHVAVNNLAFTSALGGQNYGYQQNNLTGNARTNGGQFVFTGTNAQDIANQTAVLQQVTGSTQNQFQMARTRMGRNALSTTGAASIANPGLTGTQAAQFAQNMYMPQTSMNMMVSGYPASVLPRQPGSGLTSGAGQQQTAYLKYMSQRLGNKSFSQQDITQLLQPGSQQWSSLTNIGWSPDQISQYANQLKVTNAMATGHNAQTGKGGLSRMNSQQISQVYQELQSGKSGQMKQGQATLSKYGIPQSDWRSLTQNQGAQSGARNSATQQGFDSGLQTASKLLGEFNKALNEILTGPLGHILGFGQGAGSMLNSAGHGAEALGGALVAKKAATWGAKKLGHAAVGKGVTGLLKKGASKIGGTLGRGAAEDLGAEAGADAGADAAVGGTGIGLPIAAGLLAGQIGAGVIRHTPLGKNKYGRVLADSLDPVGDIMNPKGTWHDIANIFGGGAASPQGKASPNSIQYKDLGTPASGAMKAVKFAEAMIGQKYQYGSLDCSGLAGMAYQQAGIKLPRTATQQERFLQRDEVSPRSVMAGDLVFQGGTGANMHEAMVVDSGKHIIEAPGTGQSIRKMPYNPSEWDFAARPTMPTTQAGKSGKGKGQPGYTKKGVNQTSGGAGVSAAQDNSMLSFMMGQVGKGYSQASRFGPSTYDCSGLVYMAAQKAGVSIAGGSTTTPEVEFFAKQQGATLIKSAGQVQRGDIVFFPGSDPSATPYGSIGHVGMATGSGQYVSAYDTQQGVIVKGLDSPLTVAVRPAGGGAAGGGQPAATASQPTGGSAATTGRLGSSGGASGGMGDNLTGGSSSEASNFLGGISGSAGNVGYAGGKGSSKTAAPAGGGPAGSAVAGSQTQNGTAIYKYLLSALFSGNKVAAAGAIASMWGESGWNPDSQGSGGRGLIGWTPASTLPNSAFTGNATADLNAQLPLIVKFVQTSGDQGAIQQMLGAQTVSAAANIWGRQVERFGINDVHSAGIAAAAAIAGLPAAATGGTFLVGERGRELVNVTPAAGGAMVNVTSNAQTEQLLNNAVQQPSQGPHAAGMPGGYNYSRHSPVQGSGGSGGVNVTFAKGSIVMNMAGGSLGGTGVSATPRNFGRQFMDEVEKAMRKINVDRAIRTGSDI